MQRREATRGALIAAARACFVDVGFEGTSTEAVLARAGVSKGALYHHFASKADLLSAVFEAASRAAADRAHAATAGAPSARAAVGAALKAWLRAALEPEPRRIILDIGPAVLGLARARQIEDAITLAPLRRSVERAVAQGEARCADADLAARLLSAAASELALTALQRGLSGADLAPFDAAIDALLDALLPPQRPAAREAAGRAP
ncbi:MAG: helix-turn-helix domain-containing protein [Hyphomonadaceae bacterium]|nr:helix-turn-helix domain-containing protein [Hyphomonadaceae bacterium]